MSACSALARNVTARPFEAAFDLMNSLGEELTLMKIKHFSVILIILALATPLGAQMGMGMRTPNLSGVWHPVVGSGGAYESTDRDGKKTPIEATVVGKEDVNGKRACRHRNDYRSGRHIQLRSLPPEGWLL